MRGGPDPKVAVAWALLVEASRLIGANAASLIEAHSTLVSLEPAGAEPELVPVPGSIEPDAIPLIARQIRLLREINAWVGGPLELGPGWFVDLVAQRNGWEGGQL
jgi:hypothetical protein